MELAWKGISDAVIRRLPLYLRVLEEVKDRETPISSHELGERAGVRPALVRKDLAWFGELVNRVLGMMWIYFKMSSVRSCILMSLCIWP